MLDAMCFEMFAPWLCMPMKQASRVYLEVNRELLSPEYERLLDLLISQHNDDQHEQRRLHTRKQLLLDARERGGTVQAVREAYVNMCGGLILDLPAWLVEIEQQLTIIARIGWTERMVAVCKMRLHDIIDVAHTEREIVPETQAELQYSLGNLFATKSPDESLATLKRAVEYYEATLQVYTFERYPRQYAKVLKALVDIYMKFPTEQCEEKFKETLHSYKIAFENITQLHSECSIMRTLS